MFPRYRVVSRHFALTAGASLIVALTDSVVGRAANAPVEIVRITSVTNVTLRTLPIADAPAVTQVPLGTEVRDAGPIGLDKTWIRVRLADNREGWVLSRLTATLDPVWRWPTYDKIIADRVGRKGDGFPAVIELVAFIERVAPEYTDPDGRARVELARLRALSTAASLIPFRGATREPYASWLAARKNDVEYDEPGKRWLLANEPIWALHAKHASTSVADDIAWLAVQIGFGGECGGRLTCYVEWRNRLQGEYLRRLPAGKHAEEALGVVKDTVDLLSRPAKPHEVYAFDRARDCRAFTSSLDALTMAVKGTHGVNRDATMGSLGTLRKLCS